jgi:hypothetical protein
MRVLISALGIVVSFGFGVWGIAALLGEDAPQWIGPALAIVWLFALVYLALLITNGSNRGARDQRLLGYGLLPAVLMAGFLVPVLIFHVNLSKGATEAILGAIGIAAFMLSSYMEIREGRGNSREGA